MTHFTQFHHIHEAHKPILDKVVDNHPAEVNTRLLAKLYQDTLTTLTVLDGKVFAKLLSDESIAVSRIASGHAVIATTTDTKTGVYLQLAQVDNQPRTMLTVGWKWAMESPNAQVGNVATTLW
jgi:hypothetical protein